MRGVGMRGPEGLEGISNVYSYIDWVYIGEYRGSRCNSRFCNIGHGSYAALVKNLKGLLDWDSLDARSICIQYHYASRS